jgi:RNA polymerase sigma factor (sigma-70 family)
VHGTARSITMGSVAGAAPIVQPERVDPGRLLVAHRDGDPSAFASLVAQYLQPVYGYLVRCGVRPEDREDLFQAIFLRVHRSVASYRPDRPGHPWMFTIVANEVRRYFRRRRLKELIFGAPPIAVPERPDTAADPEHRATARERLALLERALDQLPHRQREILVLGAIEGLPMEEVGQILGLPVNTVKTLMRRARLALARAVRREERP